MAPHGSDDWGVISQLGGEHLWCSVFILDRWIDIMVLLGPGLILGTYGERVQTSLIFRELSFLAI